MSVFNLITDKSQIESANGGVANFAYEQVTSTRNVQGASFPNGSQFYKWQVGGLRWWLPSKSYFRLRGKLTAPGDVALALAADVAPSMNPVASLFQSVEFRIANKTVERISDYVSEVDTLQKRQSRSRGLMQSIDDSACMMDPMMVKRQALVTSDAPSQIGYGTDSCGRDAIAMLAINPGAAPTVVVAVVAGPPITVTLTFANITADQLASAFVVGETLLLDSSAGNDGIFRKLKILSIVALVVTCDPQGQTIVALAPAAPALPRLLKPRLGGAGTVQRQETSFELIWQPSMGIFNVGHALPAGRYEMVMNPHNSAIYQKKFIQSLVADRVPGVDFSLVVDDMFFYAATVEGPRADDVSYLLDLECVRCQTQNIQNATNFQQENFDVSPSSFGLTVAFQSQSAGESSLFPGSFFKGVNESESALTRMYVNYAGQSRPSPDADPQYDTSTTVLSKDYTTQRYIESMIHTGAYFDGGGGETIQEWRKRGPYYYFAWPKDGSDRSTRVNVHFGHGDIAAADSTLLRILLFDHYKQAVRVRVEGGQVVAIQSELA